MIYLCKLCSLLWLMIYLYNLWFIYVLLMFYLCSTYDVFMIYLFYLWLTYANHFFYFSLIIYLWYTYVLLMFYWLLTHDDISFLWFACNIHLIYLCLINSLSMIYWSVTLINLWSHMTVWMSSKQNIKRNWNITCSVMKYIWNMFGIFEYQ